MHPRRTWLIATTLTAGLALLAPTAQAADGWNWSWTSGPRVEGSGKVVEQARTVTGFQRLRLEGPFNVIAQPSAAASVMVRADDNLQALVTTEVVEGDVLLVRPTSNQSFNSRSPITVTVGFQVLKSASIKGSGDLTVNDLTGERFEMGISGAGDARLARASLKQLKVSIAGSGDVTAQGTADSAEYNIAGSGDVHADKMLAAQAKVSIAGSGDAAVHATEALNVSIAGSGDVRYAGQPKQLKKSVAGSGSIDPMR
jgi:hypothetical protein